MGGGGRRRRRRDRSVDDDAVFAGARRKIADHEVKMMVNVKMDQWTGGCLLLGEWATGSDEAGVTRT